MRRVRRWLLLGCFLAGLGLALGVLLLDARVRAYLAGPPLGGSRIYAAPTVLRVDEPVPGGSVARKLARLGYRPVSGAARAPAPGEFRVDGAAVEIAQRPSPAPWGEPPRRVRVTVSSGRVAELRDPEAGVLDRLELEPEMLAVTGGGGPALGADAELAPPACRAAVLAAEDRNFFLHPGIDPVAVVRALLADFRAGSRQQGGSTITQQLVKNAFLSPRRTLWRKVQEAVLAMILEVRATKEEIFGRYLASVYLGVDGGLPVHGFPQAATVYFGKPLGDLSPAECALLAGIIRSPNGLSPRSQARAAVARRNRVLKTMEETRSLDGAVAANAIAEPLKLAPPSARPVSALYVAAEVSRQLPRLLPSDVAEAPGLTVFTSIDADAQREAERAARRGLAALERGRRRSAPLQAALVALDPHTGRVRALVGGRDYGSSPLDRAVRARRQPGSAFKPFVYLAALDPARRGDAPPLTVVSTVEDEPISVRVGATLWQPANYDGSFAGTISVEQAIAESRNAATVRLALDIGVDAIAQAAADLGITGTLPRVPSLALGVADTSLLELTAAYGVFAGGGVRRAPDLVVAVASPSGEMLYAAPPTEARVLSPEVAYLMTHLLEGVIEKGTGRSSRDAGLEGPAAGKTGTTDDTRDAWFIGYTPDVVAGVWVGLDGGGPTGLTGAQGALPIWTDFVRATAVPGTASDFPVPEGIVWRVVDPTSGGLATSACPAAQREPFIAGTEPRTPCELHRPVWAAVGDELGGAVRDGGRAIEHTGRRFRGWLDRLFR
ncbi:MAG TPA: PBP1A family penicillin-binding protein [Candidatus Binatus sp.]|nr:PBP1A family penicillin-binding protein [Candidatus Binatus sp.]